MNPQHLRDRVSVEASLLEWMTVHGNVCLGLRHPQNEGGSREIAENFALRIAALLQERGVLNREEAQEASSFERGTDAPMTLERFNQLLQGPLAHPLVPFMINRLAGALFAVVNAAGAHGARVLEEYCASVEFRDRHMDGDADPE